MNRNFGFTRTPVLNKFSRNSLERLFTNQTKGGEGDVLDKTGVSSDKSERGFTLIELLVVIAIIGILSSVVLASLNNARGRGANASVKANLASFRAQAEIYYDTTGNNTYGANGNATSNCLTVCSSCTAAQSIFAGLRTYLTAAQSAGGGTALCVAQPLSNSTSYVVSVQLRQAEGTFNHWCVDSSGNSRGHATAISGSPTVCP